MRAGTTTPSLRGHDYRVREQTPDTWPAVIELHVRQRSLSCALLLPLVVAVASPAVGALAATLWSAKATDRRTGDRTAGRAKS